MNIIARSLCSLTFLLFLCGEVWSQSTEVLEGDKHMAGCGEKSETEWAEALTPEQFEILRKKGTERPFSGVYTDNKEPGVYRCAGCGAELFRSDTKYNSGSGWPSFYSPATSNAVITERDTSHGMDRIEVKCAKCGGHLGHMFSDGPQPTGLRYCINSGALDFKRDEAVAMPK